MWRRCRGSTRCTARAPPLRFSGPVGPARIPRSFPSISASPFVRTGRPGPPLRRRRSAVTTSWGDVCSAPGRHTPPRWGGPSSLRPTSARRRRPGSTRRAARASPLGPRGPGSDPRSPIPRPQWRRSSSLHSSSMWRRCWGSTWCAARAPPLRFSGPVGPARISRSFPSISASPFVRAVRPGPPLRRRRSAVTAPVGAVCSAPGRHPHPRWGGRLRSALQARGAAARVLPGALPALPPGFYPARGPPAVEAAAPPPSTFLCRCRPAPLRVAVDGRECLRSTTYPDCRRCLFAGLSRRRCPRAGPAGPLRRGRCSAAPAVPLPLLPRSIAGGR
jgi:hypothetical protein